MLTILADENIAAIDDYIAPHTDIQLIKLAGRDINQHSCRAYQPDALFIRSVTSIRADNLGDLSWYPKLKFIGSATIGIDHVDTQYTALHGITFANATGCSKHSVAQYVITAILHQMPHTTTPTAKPITLGIIGLGNIGSTLARYALSLGWQVAGYDPFLPPSAINNATLDTLLATSDVISIHTPLTKTGTHPTYQLLNAHTLSHIKDGALIINTARGEIVVEADLLTAITAKKLRVVLDVFPDEPVISQTLLDSLALATPHIAGYTLEGKLRGTDMIYQAFCHTFGLPILQDIQNLLPPNPYHWQELKADFGKLASFYDIRQDDTNLRAVCTKADTLGISKVPGHDFDNLRKTYPLKREWLFDG